MATSAVETMAKRGRPPELRERIIEIIREHGPATPSGIERLTSAEGYEGDAISRQNAGKSMKAALRDNALIMLPLANGTYALPEDDPQGS